MVVNSGALILTALPLLRRAILANYLIQSALALLLSSILRPRFDDRDYVSKATAASMLSPCLMAVLGAPDAVLDATAVLSLVRQSKRRARRTTYNVPIHTCRSSRCF